MKMFNFGYLNTLICKVMDRRSKDWILHVALVWIGSCHNVRHLGGITYCGVCSEWILGYQINNYKYYCLFDKVSNNVHEITQN